VVVLPISYEGGLAEEFCGYQQSGYAIRSGPKIKKQESDDWGVTGWSRPLGHIASPF